MATATLEINAMEASFLAILSDLSMETRELIRALMREQVRANQAAAAAVAGGAQ